MASAALIKLNNTHLTTCLSEWFPKETWGQSPALHTFELIVANDQEALRKWISTDTVKKVNDLATEMLLHPLHVCAMTGHLECAQILLDSKVCKIDPQDASDATPLHHAAVQNHREMITFFLKNKAQLLPDQYGGTYVHLLRQLQELQPEQQTFYLMTDQGIVKSNGTDFERLTGAKFLDKDCQITPDEWMKLWRKKGQKPDMMPASLKRQYEDFCKKAPLVYLENHPQAGLNVCAGEAIEPGQVIGEYLGDIREEAGAISAGVRLAQLAQRRKDNEYVFGDIDGTRSRGLVPMCNDSFPNARVYNLYNTKGLPIRHVVVAISPIKKGDPIVYNYGIGHSTRMDRRSELRKEAFLNFFKSYSSKNFIDLYNDQLTLNQAAYQKGFLAEGEASLPNQALIYAITTPAAMLQLICKNLVEVDDIRAIFETPECLYQIKMTVNGDFAPDIWARLVNFYRTTFIYFDLLKLLADRERRGVIAKLNAATETVSADELIKMMKGNPDGYIKLLPTSAISTIKKRLKDHDEQK